MTVIMNQCFIYKTLFSFPSRVSKCFTGWYMDDDVELCTVSMLCQEFEMVVCANGNEPQTQGMCPPSSVYLYIHQFLSYIKLLSLCCFPLKSYMIDLKALKYLCTRHTCNFKCFSGEVRSTLTEIFYLLFISIAVMLLFIIFVILIIIIVWKYFLNVHII